MLKDYSNFSKILIKHRYVDYGAWETIDLRELLLRNFLSGWGNGTPCINGFPRLYRDSVTSICTDDVIRKVVRQIPAIEQDLLEECSCFFDASQSKLDIEACPFEDERAAFTGEKCSDFGGFCERWTGLIKKLKSIYSKQEIDLNFYKQQIKCALKPQEGEDAVSIEGIRRSFLRRWEKQLKAKERAWKIEQIASWRDEFLKELHGRLEQLLELKQVLGSMASKLGRLWDLSKGNWSLSGLEDLKRYAAILERKKELLELAEMLGRLAVAEKEFEERSYKATKIVQRWHTSPVGKSELVGIHESNDLSAMLPHETALLSDPLTESVFLNKFAEKKLQTFEFTTKESEDVEEEIEKTELVERQDKRGPIIICIDTSGSMHGAPENVAKAMALALMKIAAKDKRKCFMISFSTGIETLELTELSNSLGALCNFLSHSFHGGTDADPAFYKALDMLQDENYEKADVMIASDFIMPSVSSETQKKMGHAKGLGTRFHALAVGSSQYVEPITDFDYVWNYEPHNPKALLRQIECIRLKPDPVKIEEIRD